MDPRESAMPILHRPPTFAPWVTRASGRRLAPCLCLALLCAAGPAWGQGAADPVAAPAPDAAAAASALEALIQRVDQLETEVRTLRAQLAARLVDAEQAQAAVHASVPAPAPGVLAAAASAPRLPAAIAHDHAAADAAAAAESTWQNPRTQFHWFSDVGYTVSDRRQTTSSFGLGQLDLFLTSALNERWSVLSEIVFRANSDNRFVVNPERLLVQYQPSDRLQIVMGRFHSAVGYYHTVYHHGSWFETAAARPSLFGAGFVPYHNVGISAHAKLPVRPGRPRSDRRAGQRPHVGLARAGGDPERRRREQPQGLQPGGGRQARGAAGLPGRRVLVPRSADARRAVADRRPHDGGARRLHRPRLGSAQRDRRGPPRRRGRLARPRLVPVGYSQSSYRIRRVRPYVRYQVVQGDAADPIFGTVGHRYGPVAGVRVELGKFAALKVHLDHSRQSATGTTSNDGVVRLAFTF